MGAVGGSIESVSLDGRNFSVAADADVSRKLGGFENEIMPNGDATTRLIKTRVAWMLDGLTLTVDDVRGDHEFINELSKRNDYFPIAATYVSGETYQGSGQISGETQSSSQTATVAVSLSGPGELTKQ